MESQFVDTHGISIAADRIRIANTNINSRFQTMRSSMARLSNWIGSAGSVAQSARNQLLEHNTPRSDILQNYVNLLNRQVNPGYVSAENTNTSLADKFK